MLIFLVLFSAVTVSGVLAFSPVIRRSSFWRATVTPLASIMGSGFLVVAPLLNAAVGKYAVIAMGGLLAAAYVIGGVIRYNIRHAEPLLCTAPTTDLCENPGMHRMHRMFRHTTAVRMETGLLRIIERVSHMVLACAYFISISYYLQLLAAFALQEFDINRSQLVSRLIVTALITSLGLVGVIAGLRSFERIEKYVVALNLGMIASLIVALAWKNVALLSAGDWALPSHGVTGDPWQTTRVLMGMLIVVQGFETSRFIGSEHSADERIRSMRFAQWISTGVYLVFLSLVAVMFAGPSAPAGSDVTAIILVAGAITPLLAAAVAITAIGSQFTASTADFAGCAGLMESTVARVVPGRFVYVLIAAVSIMITWATNVFEIISIASRAFALFYALQCFVALLTSVRTFSTEKNKAAAIARASLFALLGLVCLAITVFGIPAG